MRHLGLLLLAACGRLGFDASPRGDDAAPGGDGNADAPAVPSTVCSVDHVPLTAVPSNADLAIAPTPEGTVALWADVDHGGTIAGARLDPQHALIAMHQVPIDTHGVGGVVDAGMTLEVGVPIAGGTSVWTVPYDLSNAMQIFSTSGLTARDPFPSDEALSPRAYVTAIGTSINLLYVNSDGSLTGMGGFTTANPVTSLAGADGPNHAHVVWTEDLGGGASRCTATDLDFVSPGILQFGGMEQLSDDCLSIRNDTGPFAPDGMMIVWTTAARTVEARYIVSTGNVSGQLSTKGRAPRVAYDGARVWVAWIDERTNGGELHFASYDITTGNLVETALPGWVPNGDEAFELFREGPRVFLAILSNGSLDLLHVCG